MADGCCFVGGREKCSIFGICFFFRNEGYFVNSMGWCDSVWMAAMVVCLLECLEGSFGLFVFVWILLIPACWRDSYDYLEVWLFVKWCDIYIYLLHLAGRVTYMSQPGRLLILVQFWCLFECTVWVVTVDCYVAFDLVDSHKNWKELSAKRTDTMKMTCIVDASHTSNKVI